MSSPSPRRPSGSSPWPAVVSLLALALVVGWGIGQLPGPPTAKGSGTPAEARTPAVNPGPAGGSPAGSGLTAAGGFRPDPRFTRPMTGVDVSAPPAAEPPRAAEEPRAEFSAWTTLAAATAESRRSGKPIMLDFNAEWCGPCQAMKRMLFDGPLGMEVQNTVIPVSIVDRAREEGANPPETESLQARYGVDAFPTLVVYSPATGRILTTRGFGGAERTLQWIREAARAVR